MWFEHCGGNDLYQFFGFTRSDVECKIIAACFADYLFSQFTVFFPKEVSPLSNGGTYCSLCTSISSNDESVYSCDIWNPICGRSGRLLFEFGSVRAGSRQRQIVCWNYRHRARCRWGVGRWQYKRADNHLDWCIESMDPKTDIRIIERECLSWGHSV